jgi:hypothetical protein
MIEIVECSIGGHLFSELVNQLCKGVVHRSARRRMTREIAHEQESALEPGSLFPSAGLIALPQFPQDGGEAMGQEQGVGVVLA